ncbi:MAG: hypothetical protein M3R04_03115 [bacterium]|nr:hypothetical protein [bacterium]
MVRTHLPISLMLFLLPLALLLGCEEDPATAMLRQAQTNSAGGGAAAPPPAAVPPAGVPPAGQAVPPGAPGGVPPTGDGRGAPVMPGGAAPAETEDTGPKASVTVKKIDAPYPRYSGKGRYDIDFEVTVKPSQDEGVWRISALDEKGKVVGSEERQMLLLREKPQSVVVNDLYCTAKPVAIKMELALDDNGQPKVAVVAGGGTGAGGGASQPPSGAANPPGGAANPPSGAANPPSDGRGAGGGGDAPPPPPPAEGDAGA